VPTVLHADGQVSQRDCSKAFSGFEKVIDLPHPRDIHYQFDIQTLLLSASRKKVQYSELEVSVTAVGSITTVGAITTPEERELDHQM